MLVLDLLAAHFAEKLAAQAGAVSERMNARPAHAEAADSPGTFSARRKNNRSQRHDLGSSPGLAEPPHEAELPLRDLCYFLALTRRRRLSRERVLARHPPRSRAGD